MFDWTFFLLKTFCITVLHHHSHHSIGYYFYLSFIILHITCKSPLFCHCGSLPPVHVLPVRHRTMSDQDLVNLLNDRTKPNFVIMSVQIKYIVMSDEKILGKLFATQALSQTQKNVSEPQTGIEPATFWSPVRRSNHWAARTQMAERRPRCVPVRKHQWRASLGRLCFAEGRVAKTVRAL